jgi:hypothetical protein
VQSSDTAIASSQNANALAVRELREQERLMVRLDVAADRFLRLHLRVGLGAPRLGYTRRA